MTTNRNRIAPTRKLGKRRITHKITTTTPPPRGLPAGHAGRVEHMRAHAMAYFAEDGARSPQGQWLWKVADMLAENEQ